MTLSLQLFSAVSFLFFGTACLATERMRLEFARYRLDRWRSTVGIFQLLGAIGLLVGLWLPWGALLSAGGLALMMFLGVFVRVRLRDSFLQTLPALFYLLLNAWLLIRLLT